MDYVVRVEFIHGLAHLPNEPGYFLLRHGLVLFELLEELAACANFQDDVDVHMIIKEPVHPDNVGMVEETLYFKLPDELLSDLLLLYQLLLNNLEGKYEICLLLSR